MDVSSFFLLFQDLEEYYYMGIPIAIYLCIGLGPIWGLASTGDQQRREAGGSRLRLWIVSFLGYGLALLPIVVSLIAFNWIPGADESIPAYALLTSIWAWFGVALTFRPPRTNGKQPLPLVTDPAFLSRMQQLAARMKLRLPTIRLLRTASPELSTTAWAGGLPCLSLVVSDGILHRLDPIEQETIAAHEMAHIVNGSLWVYAAFIPLACSTGVVALACHVHTWAWVIPATYVGLWRILARRLEYDCDLRAARAVGFPELATALTKIYKIGFGNRMDLLQSLFYATDGHPAVENRVAYLARHASVPDRPRMPGSADSAAGHTRLAWASACLWVLAMIIAWRLGQIDRRDTFIASAVLLTTISITPWILWYLATRNRAIPLWSLLRVSRNAPFSFSSLGLMIVGAGCFAAALGRSNTSALMIAGLGLLLAGVWLNERHNKQGGRYKQFDDAWAQLDFAAVIAISEQAPAWLASDRARRVTAAVAKSVMGRFDVAIAELEQLDRETPLQDIQLIWYVATQIEAALFEQALQTAARIKTESPRDGVAEALTSRIMRRLGRLDDARKQAALSLELAPQFASMWAAAAGIEIECGDYTRAREFLDRAHELAPGTPQELAESARLALATESCLVAADKLKRAIAALKANPLLLRQSEITALHTELSKINRPDV